MTDERTLPSGILLPDPAERAGKHPVALILLDALGAASQLHALAGEESTEADVAQLAEEVRAWAAAVEAGATDESFTYRDPLFGDRHHLMPAAASRIVAVGRGYTERIDPMARQRQQAAAPRLLPARAVDPFAAAPRR